VPAFPWFVLACISLSAYSYPFSDGYINEGGVIKTKRLQVILNEMGDWEQEIFEKEYADLNWYKGKQAKHMKEIESAKKRQQLGM
jgi:5'-3' exoribonuclease 1